MDAPDEQGHDLAPGYEVLHLLIAGALQPSSEKLGVAPKTSGKRRVSAVLLRKTPWRPSTHHTARPMSPGWSNGLCQVL
ncbi:MAG: hypothetical protein ACP5VR_11460 [Acidimicrobiales bacterium]